MKVAIVDISITIIDLIIIDLNTIDLISTIDLTVFAVFHIIKSFIAHFFQINIVWNFFTKSSILFEIIMFNKIIIYKSKITDFFVKIIKNFSIFWKNIEFVKMLKKNWMQFFLKIDWKTKIIDKIKIYLLKIQNRELMNKTFDDLHEIDKMFWINQSTFFLFNFLRLKNRKRKTQKTRNHWH